MDLVNAAVNFKQAETITQVQYAVARKLLDSQAQAGAAVVQLIDAAGKIGTSAGDQLVAAATGLGGNLDTYG
ncbi:MAG TPA: YjfB family protein [Tepidisphaeraceae bacterium]